MFDRNKASLLLSANAVLLAAVLIFWNALGKVWCGWDERVLALMQQTFEPSFSRSTNDSWSIKQIYGLFTLLSFVLGFAALSKKNWVFYLTGVGALCGLVALARLELAQQTFFPLASVSFSFVFMFSGLLFILKRETAKEQARLRRLFAARLSERALRQALSEPALLKLSGEEKEATLMFIRLAHDAAAPRSISAEAQLQLCNEFVQEMTGLITGAEGCVMQLAGATIMAVFGAPLPASNHAEQALHAALLMQRRLLELKKQWARVGMPNAHLQVGIHTGRVVFGLLGARESVGYQALGEGVEFAARLCRANQRFATSLLVSATTFTQLPRNVYRARTLDFFSTKNEALKIHEVHGDLATYRSPIDSAFYQNYEKAFWAYQEKDFENARAPLEAALKLLPSDPAALALLVKLNNKS